MAIQMRRGESADFIPESMLPGEWAISLDNEKVYMCFGNHRIMEIGSATMVQDSEAWAVGTRNGADVDITDPTYNNNSKYYSQQSHLSSIESSNYSDAASDSADSAQMNADYIRSVVETHAPQFTINWETGELEYTGGYFIFWVDSDGILKWGVENP